MVLQRITPGATEGHGIKRDFPGCSNPVFLISHLVMTGRRFFEEANPEQARR